MYLVLLGFKERYLVLLGFQEVYLVLLGFHVLNLVFKVFFSVFYKLYLVLPGFSTRHTGRPPRCYRVFLTGFSLAAEKVQGQMGLTGFYWVLRGFTGFYWVLPVAIGVDWV